MVGPLWQGGIYLFCALCKKIIILIEWTYADGALEFERRPLEEGGAVIIAACDESVGPGLFEVYAVNDLTVTDDLTHRGTRVPQEHCTEPTQVHTSTQVHKFGHQGFCQWTMCLNITVLLNSQFWLVSSSDCSSIFFLIPVRLTLFKQVFFGTQPFATHFSRPSPTTAIRLLSSVQLMSLIFPPKGWYSYFSRCSFWVVSQIRIFPDTSKEHRDQRDWSRYVKICQP